MIHNVNISFTSDNKDAIGLKSDCTLDDLQKNTVQQQRQLPRNEGIFTIVAGTVAYKLATVR